MGEKDSFRSDTIVDFSRIIFTPAAKMGLIPLFVENVEHTSFSNCAKSY